MSIPVFYSYSHKDEAYRETLQTHLSILKRQGYLEGWSDRKIAPGEKWEEEINLNLQKAKIVLLLVSSNFLASDYCYDTETIFALEQHAKKSCVVIPIIIKPCLWQKSHFKHLQALPKNGKPITTWKNKDEAWVNVSEGILKVIEGFSSQREIFNEEEAIEHKSNIIDSKNINVGSINITSDIIFGDNYTIQGQVNSNEPPSSVTNIEINTPQALPELLIEFLQRFNSFYFSPLRIQKWGSRRVGFQNLANYDTSTIKKELESLLRANKVKLTTSKKGNRIYKII